MGRVVVFSLFVVAMSIFVGSVTQALNAAGVRKSATFQVLAPASLTATRDFAAAETPTATQEFATFQNKMAEELNIKAKDLDTTSVRKLYAGIKSNPETDQPRIGTLGDIVLSLLCSTCCDTKTCEQYGCLTPCPA